MHEFLASPIFQFCLAIGLFFIGAAFAVWLNRNVSPKEKILYEIYDLKKSLGQTFIEFQDESGSPYHVGRPLKETHISIRNAGAAAVRKDDFLSSLSVVGNLLGYHGEFFNAELVMQDRSDLNSVSVSFEPHKLSISVDFLKPNDCVWLKVRHNYLECCVVPAGETLVTGMISEGYSKEHFFNGFLPGGAFLICLILFGTLSVALSKAMPLSGLPSFLAILGLFAAAVFVSWRTSGTLRSIAPDVVSKLISSSTQRAYFTFIVRNCV